MTNNDKEHSGAADPAGQAGNPGPMGDPSDAAIAGSAGNTGNVGSAAGGGSAAGSEVGGDMSDSGTSGGDGGSGGGSPASAGGSQDNTAAGDGDGASQEGGTSTGAGSGQGGEAVGGEAGEMATTRSTDQAGGSVATRTGILIPPVDVIEDANGITLLADMPGVSKDKLDLRLETNSLTINGAVSLDVPEGMESRYAEVKHQQYQRTFALSKELDGEQASAELTHGVLKIRIPKTAHAQPRRVQINVA